MFSSEEKTFLVLSFWRFKEHRKNLQLKIEKVPIKFTEKRRVSKKIKFNKCRSLFQFSLSSIVCKTFIIEKISQSCFNHQKKLTRIPGNG
jgi:hypothetical protein